MVKLNQLEYFCAVSRYHSITKAAKDLYVTQPAISTAIRELEKEFSLQLFIRQNNRLSLTPEGELFYEKARSLLNQAQETEAQLHDLGNQMQTIRIGIPPLLSTVVFPDLYLSFHEKYPDIEAEMYEYGSIRACQMVQEELLDVALGNMSLADIEKFQYFKLAQEQLVYVVSKKHPLASCSSISVAQLKEEPLIMFNTDSVQTQSLNARFNQANIIPNILLYASQIRTIEKFISHELAGAFFYASMLKEYPDLVGIPLDPPLTQDIGLVWRKGKYISSSVEKFISFTQKYYFKKFH